MQKVLVAGDTLKFPTSIPDYPASDGWVLTYKLIPRTSGSVITITASADGDGYQVEVAASTTANYGTGNYSWAGYVTLGSESYTLDGWIVDGETIPDGYELTVKPNPRTATTYDNRSHARTALEAIEAVLEGRATLDQEEYAINGRSLKRTPLAELWRHRMRYVNEVRGQEATGKINAGLGGGNKLAVRF